MITAAPTSRQWIPNGFRFPRRKYRVRVAEVVRTLPSRGENDGAWWLEQLTRTVFRAGRTGAS